MSAAFKIFRSLILVIVLISCIWLGGHPKYLPEASRKLLTEQKSDLTYQRGRDLIQKYYYRPLSTAELDDQALQSITSNLDPYSQYLNGKDLADFSRSSQGEYAGIGVRMSVKKDRVFVEEVTANSPADKKGLLVGDIIIKVGKKDVSKSSIIEIGGLVRGEPNTKVSITVLRKNKPITFEMKRAVLKQDVVSYKTTDDPETVRIAFYSFSDGSAEKLRQAVKKAVKNKKNIILDLRGNGGGQVDEAVKTLSVFLPKNTLVVSLKGRAVESHKYYTEDDPVSTKINLKVLVDRNTASASEIVAASLQEEKRAKVYGVHTFGKGVYQELFPLAPYPGQMKLTVGSYYTAKGKNLGQGIKQGKGVIADIKAEDNLKTEKDEALDITLNK